MERNIGCIDDLAGLYLFRSERKELQQIIPQIQNADGGWLFIGIGTTALLILFQSGMYVSSFASIGLSLKWLDAMSDALSLLVKYDVPMHCYTSLPVC